MTKRFVRCGPQTPFAWRKLVPVALCLGINLIAQSANADTCFPKPVALPTLSGPPDWRAPGTVRTELNEPRWAAAPQTAFESDATALEGRYRILVNSASNQLSVSFQAPNELNVISAADAIYFGLTRDGTAGTLASAVRLNMPTAMGTDPINVTQGSGYRYDAGATPKWTSAIGVPDWVIEASAWKSDTTADWGINFKVDLSAASLSGLSVSAPLKIMFAMHIRDEANPAASLNPSTPNPSCIGATCALPLEPGTLLIANPASWALASAINAACPGGITLDGTQIGTTNEKPPGTPAPNIINTSSGKGNRFYARPSFVTAPFAGLIQARFHVANWGSVPAPNAPWVPLPGPAGGAFENGTPAVVPVTEIRLDCPTNSGGLTCGITTPGAAHQCLYVELSAAPGQTVKFTTAVAYRNMEFQPLSDFSAPAEISVRGLEKVFGNKEARDVYVYVHTRNMPAHRNEAVFLQTDLMAATRRFAETPPLQLPDIPDLANIRDGEGELRRIPASRTGIADLALEAQQALRVVWPTYDVFVYYDTGHVLDIDGVKVKHLAAMYPFTYFHSHAGPLYGFSHDLSALGGAQLEELRPNVYLLKIANESVAQVTTHVSAHEKPKDEKPPIDCPKCPKVEKCSATPGTTEAGRNILALFAVSLLTVAVRRRARARVRQGSGPRPATHGV